MAESSSNLFLIGVDNLTVNDKCTWVGYGAIKPPTFKIAGGTGTHQGINASSPWIIHHMEYNSD